MALRVIGAGLPRTGTTSLKNGLERLLDGPCYHMFELFPRIEDHGPRWYKALCGAENELDDLLEGWVAAVDWPAAILWSELAARHPDALVVLSHRGSAETWWASADATVWTAMRRSAVDADPRIREFNAAMRRRAGFGDDDWDDPAAAMARYDDHYASVVSTVSADRLLVWEPSEGWEPLCERLGVAVPDEPLGRSNDRAEFRARLGLSNTPQ